MAEYGNSKNTGGIQPLTSSTGESRPTDGRANSVGAQVEVIEPQMEVREQIIGFGADGNPNCVCKDGRVYTNCGENCGCCDHVDVSEVYLPKDQQKYETISCPCSSYSIKNKFGNIECEMKIFGKTRRVMPITITNHTIGGVMPIIGDKWNCISGKTCSQGAVKWDSLHVVKVEGYTNTKFVPITNTVHSTSNCYIPKTSLNDYNGGTTSPLFSAMVARGYEAQDMEHIEPEGTIDNLSLFSTKEQAQEWNIHKNPGKNKVSEYIGENGIIKYLAGSSYPNRKQINSCYINKKDIIYVNASNNWDYKVNSSQPGKAIIKTLGDLLEIKIQGSNKPMVDISIKDSSNRSLLKRKLKNIIINGEYIFKQKIPALGVGKTQETYNITITPSADTSYYYNNELISIGILKYTIWQFKKPTITFGSENSPAGTTVTQTGTGTVSGTANSFSSKPVTIITTLTNSGGFNYYRTGNTLTFDDLINNNGGIKKIITDQEDKKELECRETVTLADSSSDRTYTDGVSRNRGFTAVIEPGMTFTGKITKTKTVYKSIDLDEHLKEPCDEIDVVDILTNKFELENTTYLFSGMAVEGVDNNGLEFVSTLESVDCGKGITLTSHHIIRKETILTFTHNSSGIIREVHGNNVTVVPCVKLPNKTEITFNKSNKSNVSGEIFVDKNGSEKMVITTIIKDILFGQDDLTFNLDLSKIVDVKPPVRDKRLICGKDSSIKVNFDTNVNSYNISQLVHAITSTPKNGELGSVTHKSVVNERYKLYTPNSGFTGEDKFTFTLADGDILSEEKTIYITVK